MYIYQDTHRYFAQMPDDIKEIAGEEIARLGGAQVREAYRGVYFTAEPKALYRINYHARLIHRVLAPLVSFNCHSDRYLYRQALDVPWQDFLNPQESFAVLGTVSHSAMRHSRYAALRLKDAVVDACKARTGKRPSIDTRDPDLWLNLHIENNRATISLDTSGGSLHRRGYRMETVPAPMMETLAAAVLVLTQWKGDLPLYDPFCGSGTILCEAYLHASRTPSGILRERFGFERLPDFQARLWKEVAREGRNRIREIPAGRVAGSDTASEAVKAARGNCALIDSGGRIRIEQKDVFSISGLQNVTIVCNPPYGIRQGIPGELPDFYRRLGDFLKRRCTGSTAYVYFGRREHIKHVGLKPSWKRPLSNSGLDGRLVKYDLY